MTALVWYRRDLRVRDHPALRAASDRHDRIVPVFCLDDRLLAGRHASGPRTAFLLESLADLDRSLYMQSTGQSGNPMSPFYRSFATRWSNGDYIEIPTRRETIDRSAIGTWKLSPR